jgi:hypothetical protein
MDISNLGRVFLLLGGLFLLLGLVFLVAGRIPFLGHLPGDIVIERDGVTVFIPLATMLVVSVVLTLLLNLAGRLFR